MSAAELTLVERNNLAFHEARIERGLRHFIAVGESLTEIRDQRLYRATHATFESYCGDRWNIRRAHAYRLITAAEVVSPIGDKAAITTESQARELARVEPERRQEVVNMAVAATGGKVTAAAIRDASRPPQQPPTVGLPAHGAPQSIRESVYSGMGKLFDGRRECDRGEATLAAVEFVVEYMHIAKATTTTPSCPDHGTNAIARAEKAVAEISMIGMGDRDVGRLAALTYVEAYVVAVMGRILNERPV